MKERGVAIGLGKKGGGRKKGLGFCTLEAHYHQFMARNGCDGW
jgi:hypothetical protein